jgi:hypothetical protein
VHHIDLMSGILALFAPFFMMQVKNVCGLAVLGAAGVYCSETLLWFHERAISIWIASLAKDRKA